MRLFGRDAGKRKQPGPLIRDPFAVVPLRPDNVELRHDSTGCAHLRMQPAQKGLRARLGNWLGYDYSRKVQLDDYGTLYISLVDGRNRLHDIVDRMVAQFGKDRKEVEQGVILFTKKLMTMNMIVLKMEG